MQALAEIVGPYGIQYLGDKLMDLVSAQVKELKKLVEQNLDTLLALHTNRDKPDIFNDLFRKLRSELVQLIVNMDVVSHHKISCFVQSSFIII